jgi:lysyl-tRNA synthetase class 1
LLTSVLDVTQGNVEQALRIASQYTGKELRKELVEPRLTCALNWVNHYLPEDEHTPIRSTFNGLVYPQLPEQDRAGIRMLVQVLDEHWNLESLTALVYNEELRQAQRLFFIAIYQLICGRETGPRIPTLLLSLGKEKVKALLSPEGLSFEA